MPRVLALAHHWRGLIRPGAACDQADLARLVGASRARGTQVMNLPWLAPDIQEAVHLEATDDTAAAVALRRVASQPVWSEQQHASS